MQKEIKGFSNYLITDDGKVISKVTGKVLKTFITHNGYEKVSLSQNGVEKKFRIHRLVAEAFIEKPEGYDQVNHKDENKRNNHVSNLEWITPKLNSNYGTRSQRLMMAFGTRVESVDADGNTEKFNSYQEAGRKGKGSPMSIRRAVINGTVYHGKRWKLS